MITTLISIKPLEKYLFFFVFYCFPSNYTTHQQFCRDSSGRNASQLQRPQHLSGFFFCRRDVAYVLEERSAVDAAPVLLAELPLHPPQRLLHVRPGRTRGEPTGESHRFALDGKKNGLRFNRRRRRRHHTTTDVSLLSSLRL